MSLGALRHNCREAGRLVGDAVRVMAIVKADAYGHGGVPAAKAFLEGGASLLGVSMVSEGAQLRAAGIDVPIVVLWGTFTDEAEVVAAHDLAPAVWSTDALDALGAAGRAAGRAIDVHVKIDTGMTRLGVDAESCVEFARRVVGTDGVTLAGVFSHLASADEIEQPAVQAQIAHFDGAVQVLGAAGLRPDAVHLANSAAVLSQTDAHWNVVRPGIMLYGYVPAPHLAERAALRPAMQLVTEIGQLRTVPAGRGVGYGAAFVTERPSRIAVLPIGYADGYHRLLGNRAEVVVRGRRAPVAGRVCMDHVMVDVTDVPGVGMGDRVRLLGCEGEAAVWADEVGAWGETISYEVLTAVGRRVPRVYVEDFG